MRVTFLFCTCLAAQFFTIASAADKEKPALKVTKDGFPAGHDTPEGAACDLARAFIQRDAKLFEETCIKPFSGGKSKEEYSKFLKETGDAIREQAKKKDNLSGPKEIVKVFAARKLSKDRPASYGFATFEFKEVMFVDVSVNEHGDKKFLNRTLVIKDKAGKWYVHPLPDSSPLLSDGLNDEADSKIDFSDVYKIEK